MPLPPYSYYPWMFPVKQTSTTTVTLCSYAILPSTSKPSTYTLPLITIKYALSCAQGNKAPLYYQSTLFLSLLHANSYTPCKSLLSFSPHDQTILTHSPITYSDLFMYLCHFSCLHYKAYICLPPVHSASRFPF